MRLSPRDPFAFSWVSTLGYAKLVLAADEEAVALYRRFIEMNRSELLAHIHLASALAHLDRIAEARAALQTGLSIAPMLTISRYQARLLGDNPTYLFQCKRVIEGLRKAGLPE